MVGDLTLKGIYIVLKADQIKKINILCYLFT